MRAQPCIVRVSFMNWALRVEIYTVILEIITAGVRLYAKQLFMLVPHFFTDSRTHAVLAKLVRHFLGMKETRRFESYKQHQIFMH